MAPRIEETASHVRLSVVIPVYNEGRRICVTLQHLQSYLSVQQYTSEVVIVDDGSDDNTNDIARLCMSMNPQVRLITGGRNRGKGWAVREGMLQAQGDVRIFMDADNSTSIDQWERFAPLLDAGVDVVVGSRTACGAEISLRQPRWRQYLGILFRKGVRALFKLPIDDTQLGFKAFTARAALTIFPHVTTMRWAFDVEVLAIAKHLGFRMREVPVQWMHSNGSRLTLTQMTAMAWDIWKVRSQIRKFAKMSQCGLRGVQEVQQLDGRC